MDSAAQPMFVGPHSFLQDHSVAKLVKMVDEGQQRVIVKPLNDKREYKRVVLSNCLQVLLISDPDTDKQFTPQESVRNLLRQLQESGVQVGPVNCIGKTRILKAAASMDVNVGSFSNPAGLEGLAHFLEHMLFYASKKYPTEGTYNKFLSEHGGDSNAYTAAEHTNYHFDVNAGHLEEALDRFAQFFICPLLSADATSREILAVDSENSKNLTSDGWRLGQLQKHLSSKDHPYHKYETGNKDTLDTGPKARGIDTREELIKFYRTHYSAGLMCLALYGRETVGELENLVQEKFGDIKNNDRRAQRFQGSPCLPEHLQILVKAVPVRDQNLLVLVWPVKPTMKDYKKGASSYVGFFLEHEADGSLFALLKSLGWANHLSADVDESLEFAFFRVYMELTNAGQEHMQEVLDFAFQYIELLQQEGVVEWLYKEKRTMSSTWFNFSDQIDPIDYVVSISDTMHTYPPEDWLSRGALLSDFDAEAITALAQQLKPQHVRLFCLSKQYADKTIITEPWYGTPYSLEKIDDSLVKRWEIAIIDPRLHLPSPNVFLPTDFNIKDPEPDILHPVMTRMTELSMLWYKPDTKFQMPKTFVCLSFSCPESNHSPEASLLTYIFTRLFADHMNEYAYYAALAGLHYHVFSSRTGIEVVVEGFHHKLTSLVEKIVEKIASFHIEEDRFAFVHEKVTRKYVNMRFLQPHEQAHDNLNHILQHSNWHLTECLEVLPSLDAQTLTVFFPRLLSRVFVEAFIGGNISRREAEALLEHVEVTLSAGPLVNVKPPFPSQKCERRIMCLEPGSDWFYPTAGLNPDDENSSVGIYFQIGQDEPTLNVLLELFTLTAKEHFYNQLRTVEQLGYIVHLQLSSHGNVKAVQLTIQSTVKDPTRLDHRVEAFLVTLESVLEKMTDDDFKKHVKILMEMKMEKHKNLWEEGDFYWGEIYGGSFQFDRVQVEVTALKKLERQDLLEFYAQKIKHDGPQRKKLSLQVFGNQHGQQLGVAEGKTPLVSVSNANAHVNGTTNGHLESAPELIQVKENGDQQFRKAPVRIDNVQAFKRTQALYCLPKGEVRQKM